MPDSPPNRREMILVAVFTIVGAVLRFCLIAAAISLAVYWPWFRLVQAQPGGYAALVKHHQSYLSGLSAWPQHWRLQTVKASAFSGRLVTSLGWGSIAWCLAWIGGWACATRKPFEDRSQRTGLAFLVGLAAGFAVLRVEANAPWWLSLGIVPWWIVDRGPAVRLLAFAWITMAILPPFYHPDARIWLLLHSLNWLILSGLIISIGPAWKPIVVVKSEPRWRQLADPRLALVVCLLAATFHELGLSPRAHFLGSPIEPPHGLRLMCEDVERDLASSVRPPVRRLHVVSRPALMFYLSTRVNVALLRHPDLESVQKSVQSEDGALLDSTVVPEVLTTGFPLGSFRAVSLSRATTLLDLDPGVALDTGKSTNGYEWLGIVAY